MKKYTILLLLSSVIFISNAQDDIKRASPPMKYEVKNNSSYDDDSLKAYIKREVNKNYPDSARRDSIQGVVHMAFKINSDSSISGIGFISKCCEGYGMDSVSQKIISSIPKSILGRVKGKDSTKIVTVALVFLLMPKEEQVFYLVERTAVFPGGESKLYEFIRNNVVYPQFAMEEGIEGRVMVQFVIEKDGRISNVKTVGNEIGYGLEREAIRVVKKMPKWKPAEQGGEKVRMKFTLPILFKVM